MNYIQQVYKGKYEWHHWVLTILLVFSGWQILGVLPLILVAFMHAKNFAEFLNAGANNFMSLGIDKNLFLKLLPLHLSQQQQLLNEVHEVLLLLQQELLSFQRVQLLQSNHPGG